MSDRKRARVIETKSGELRVSAGGKYMYIRPVFAIPLANVLVDFMEARDDRA